MMVLEAQPIEHTAATSQAIPRTPTAPIRPRPRSVPASCHRCRARVLGRTRQVPPRQRQNAPGDSGDGGPPQARLTPKARRLLDLHRKALRWDHARQQREQQEFRRALYVQEPETARVPPANGVDWLSPQLKNQSGHDPFLYQSWQKTRKPKGFARPDAMRKYRLGEVTDYCQEAWDIRQIRPMQHGFDLLYGSRTSERYCSVAFPVSSRLANCAIFGTPTAPD